MSNEKQTAVQILVDSLIKLGYLHSNEFGQSPKVTEVINQAKEMEREQMIDTYLDGDKMEGRATLKDAEEYYDKKFNTKSEPSKQ